ncbi:ATP-binding protein [Streptomyces cinereoruber]|uniref:ATP-binding protein n=1 Tax=Streptomyces cinereoruber TaxID=67260 RepID=UPI003C2F433D
MESGPASNDATPRSEEQVIQATAVLNGDDSDIAHARHLATAFLTTAQTEHGIAVSRTGVELTQLVVSELVTNARKHAPGPARMDLRITGGVVEIVVWDCEPALPAARPADAGRVGQHGLEIVMALALDFEVHSEAGGKRITARIALTDDPDTLSSSKTDPPPAPALEH